MSKDTTLQSHKATEINLLLNEMKELGKFRGILLSSRQGRLIAENIGDGVDYSEFAAMCASVLKSTESLKSNLDANEIKRIIAELDNLTIIIAECNEKMFLTFFVEKDSEVDQIFKKLAEYNQKIINVNPI